MQKSLLAVLLAAACASPRYSASKLVELDVPLDQAERLRCTTHNGGITVSSGADTDTISLRAKMSVRGHTQHEADANLELLTIGQSRDGDELRIYGQFPRDELRNMSPSFAFTMAVPEHLALTLRTHNGNVRTNGTSGALSVGTHNGGVQGSVANPQVNISTHNGGVELAITAPGELEGSITTHNGSVRVDLHEEACGWLVARTHNGHIKAPKHAREVSQSRRSLRCRVGDDTSDSTLKVRTHNGSVVLRTEAPRAIVLN
jgi:hypothetical protein